MELLLIRHARPVRLHEAAGRPDPDLSELGGEQVRALVAALSTEHLDAIYSSPMRRADRTAQPLAEQHDLELVFDPDLAELDVGQPSYVPIEETGRSAADRAYLEAWSSGLTTPRGRATVRAFRDRVGAAVERIVAAHPGRAVAVVCHGGVINAVVTGVLGIDELLAFPVDYTSITRILASRTGQRAVRSVNEHGHLRTLDGGGPRTAQS